MITANQFRTRRNETLAAEAIQLDLDKQHYKAAIDVLLENAYNHFNTCHSEEITFSVPARRVGDRMTEDLQQEIKAYVEAAGYTATVTSRFNSTAQRFYLYLDLTY